MADDDPFECPGHGPMYRFVRGGVVVAIGCQTCGKQPIDLLEPPRTPPMTDEFEHVGISSDGVPYGRPVRSCPSQCGMFQCCREADHAGKHVDRTGHRSIIWPIEATLPASKEPTNDR